MTNEYVPPSADFARPKPFKEGFPEFYEAWDIETGRKVTMSELLADFDPTKHRREIISDVKPIGTETGADKPI